MNDHSEYRNVELRHMRLFIAVAETGGFSAAAEREDVAVSAVSEAVKRLEQRTGVRLFHRSSRRVELTVEGEGFLDDARRALQGIESAFTRLREIAGLQRGRIAVAAAPSVITRLFPPLIREFQSRHPGVHLSLRDDGAEGVARRVTNGEADFGVAGKWGANAELEFRPLLYDRFGVVCRPDSGIAREGGPVTWARLASETFVSLAMDTGIHAMLRRDEPGAVLPETPGLTVSNTLALEAMVEGGLGVTVLPDLAAQLRANKTLAFVPLTDPEIWRCIHVITPKRRTLSPASQALLALLAKRLPALLPSGMIRVA